MDALLREKILLLVLDVCGVGERRLHVAVRVAALHGVGRGLAEGDAGPRTLHDEQK